MATKQYVLRMDTIGVAALNYMFRRAAEGNLGMPLRVYSVPKNTPGPFSEWGIEFENGIICSCVEWPDEVV